MFYPVLSFIYVQENRFRNASETPNHFFSLRKRVDKYIQCRTLPLVYINKHT